MNINIENLKAQMRGDDLNIHQLTDAVIEFNNLIYYTEDLESKYKKLVVKPSIIRDVAKEIIENYLHEYDGDGFLSQKLYLEEDTIIKISNELSNLICNKQLK